MTMARILALKELSMMLGTPATYVIFVVFLLLSGWLFAGPLFISSLSSLVSFAGPMPLLFTFLLPALTMRSFSEEYRSGTIEVLATLPVRDYEIVLGKYGAVMGVLGTWLLFTLAYPLLLWIIGRPDVGHVVGTYAAIVGLGSFFGAVGLWASTLSRNAVVSFVIGFFVCFSFFLIDRLATFFPESVALFIRAFGVQTHFDALSRGVLDIRDVLYWAGGTLFFLGAALSVVHARRWK